MRHFALLLLSSAPLAAQTVPTVALRAPQAELAEPFTQVTSIRELADGRAYVADARDKVVLLIDLAFKTSVRVGRVGAGPGEFGIPRRLFAMPGDTTLLYDAAANRLLVLLSDGKAGSTRPIEMPFEASNTFRAIDDRGRIFLTTRPYGAAGNGVDDQLVRFDPRSKHVDTIARIGLPPGRITGSRTLGGGMLLTLNNKPYAKEDVTAIGTDGRVAVVRGSDYHVEWFGADGNRIAGPPVAYKPLPLTAAEKRAFLLRRVVPGQIVTNAGVAGGNAVSMPMPRGSGAMASADALDDTGMDWPTQIPAFIAGAASIAGDGTLWVLRTRAHDDSIPSYDVFDAGGRLSRHVTLPVGTRLVGFGRGTVYLVRKDADDLEYLQRYQFR
jgi:hypothetical protein